MSSTSSGKDWHSLPREIRDRIYEEVLESQVSPPLTPDCIGERLEVGFSPRQGSRYRSFHYQPFLQSNSFGLLGSCRQINDEVSELIAWNDRDNASSPLTYHLDCMIKGYKTWPTWICLPAVSRRVSNLNVDLRIFQDADVNLGGGCLPQERACHDYDGRPPRLVTPLLHILNHLFHHGPHFFQQERSSHTLTVATLTLNIVFPDAVNWGKQHAFNYFDHRVERIHQVLWNIARSGMLFGHIEKIVCRSVFYEGDRILQVLVGPEGLESAQKLPKAPLWRAIRGPDCPPRHL